MYYLRIDTKNDFGVKLDDQLFEGFFTIVFNDYETFRECVHKLVVQNYPNIIDSSIHGYGLLNELVVNVGLDGKEEGIIEHNSYICEFGPTKEE